MRILIWSLSLVWVWGAGLTACSNDTLMPTVNEANGEILVGVTAVSAPLFPRFMVFYEIEGEAYPATAAATQEWVERENPVMAFPEMVEFCLEHEPYASQITQVAPDEGLSAEELAANYVAISDCAYDTSLGFRSKPYWIPQVLEEVDICQNELGEGWSLPTESFVLSQDQSFFEDYAALHGAEATPETTASMYFSLSLYVTGIDGSLKVATLEPGEPQPARVRALPEDTDRTVHVETPFGQEDENSIWNTQTIVVRCFRPALF